MRFISVIGCVLPQNRVSETLYVNRKLKVIYDCLYNAFCNTKHFFYFSIVTNFVNTIIYSALSIVYSIILGEAAPLNVILYFVNEAVVTFVSLSICRSIVKDFEMIPLQINFSSFLEDSKSLGQSTRLWYRLSAHAEHRMVFKFFEVCYSLISFKINFVSLIAFILIQPF